ncbi:hypothetical protein [Agromyces aerolatus]|uniref:hypothetical protein n=1 Tax=Agromyces sp. LY-1074 TaxID=3074080 RepID=UPI0028674226|nr:MULTISPECIES: hypothetical protein [unclassified Agromyces]MDR5701274.1 hypothetical protein [Agromyces sp. LY-1074]MDR5707532.1 hypothetical protein [Agromyces sp. LY-1358]
MSQSAIPVGDDGLILASRARALGREADLRRLRRSESLVGVRRGVYLDPHDALGRTALQQYRQLAFAVGHQRKSPVFAAITAAVLHGLPVIGGPPAEVFVLAGGSSGRRRNGVVEIPRRGTETIVRLDGRSVTSVAECVIEVARRVPLVTALVLADAALSVPRFGASAPRCGIDDLHAAYSARLPFRCSRRVLALLQRATTQSDSPLESMSRLRIEEFGFPAPVLQFPVPSPSGTRVRYLDFAWPEHGVWGEADGRGKYGAARVDGSNAAAEVILREKRREDEIRMATGWRCVRWDWRDAWTGDPLREALVRAGLPRT